MINEDVGVDPVLVHVDDAKGGLDSTFFSIEVINVNDPPGNFTLLAPPNRTEIDTLNPTLVWQQAIDVDPEDMVHYEILVSTRADLADTLLYAQLTDTMYTIQGGLEPSRQYYWKVVALDTSQVKTEGAIIILFTTSDIATDVKDQNPVFIPTTFGLSQNLPNPFNRTTRINYQFAAASKVQLTMP